MAKRYDLSWKVVGSNPSAGKDFDLEVSIEEHSNQLIKKDLGNFVPMRDFQCNRVSFRKRVANVPDQNKLKKF